MAKLILVRHGESEGNRDRRFTITPAVGLTERGRQQAHETGRRIAKLFKAERVIASPYLRARHTGEIIAAELSVPLEIQHGLHERSFGYLAGHPYEAVENDPTLKADGLYRWRPEGGESYEDVRERVAPILDRLAAENHGRELVIVSHGGVMLSLWAHVIGNWEDARLAPNCGIVLIEHNGVSYQPPRFIED